MGVRLGTLRQREEALAYLLVFPALFVVLGVVLFPVIYNIWMSFHDLTLANLGERAPFAGLDNYLKVIRDPDFLSSLLITGGYAVAAGLMSIVVGLAAALLLNVRMPMRNVFRASFLFPYVAPLISVVYIWKWILDPQAGVANWLLMKGGIISAPMDWLTNSSTALPSVILFQGWRYFPFAMLLILARLQAIPTDLHEAAAVDGANRFQQFINITLPELRYVLGIVFLLRFVWTFNKFDDVFLLTSGAANTKVLPILTYRYAIGTGQLGVGAACSMFLFIVLVAFILVYHLKVFQWGK